MKLGEELSIRLREILLSGNWVTGTNIKNQIIDLDWKIAIQKVDNLNTIADLVFHIDYYIAGVLEAIETGKLEIRDKYSFNSPPINNKKDWKNRIDTFCNNAERFATKIEKLTNNELDKVFFSPKYGTIHRNINVIIEHSYYHFGQIILIKKMLIK
ncbi:DUF1572 family protein [Tenacibaculum aiptasiae]|uniref:DUF1572 family protein n=1 Tax=Tenacibaculum aiptasiae TaxID=426481 RepID=UPI00232C736E|nr:DUF1572 family protein [Tenacibaculum aiptasiae]